MRPLICTCCCDALLRATSLPCRCLYQGRRSPTVSAPPSASAHCQARDGK
jgi:hypothetical protein